MTDSSTHSTPPSEWCATHDARWKAGDLACSAGYANETEAERCRVAEVAHG